MLKPALVTANSGGSFVHIFRGSGSWASEGREGRKKGRKPLKKTAFLGSSQHADWQQIQIYQNRYSSVREEGRKGGEKEEREVLWQGTREKRTQERGTESTEEHAN